MPTLTVKVDTDNEAFEDDNRDPELARILRRIADDLEAGIDASHFLTVRDINGNDVGRWAIK